MSNGAHAQRKRRLPREVVRGWAWVVGGLSFLAPLTAFALQPKPVSASDLAASETTALPQVVEAPRMVQVIDPQNPSRPRYVYLPSNSNRFNSPPVTSSGAS